jgi:Protein of unknown function (DUF3176)
LEGRPWRAGVKARFPFLSFFCLLLIIGLTAGIIFILLISDGEDVDSWCAITVKIAGHYRKWRVSVSAWIALFNFITGKALAAMFTEAVAVSWWVDALRGQTLNHLHFRWEVGQSIVSILRRRLWSWICVASIAFTAFSGLEALLQEASSSTTILSTSSANMTAALANALPAGFSGVIAAISHDIFGTVYLTPSFIQILQTYTTQSPIYLDLDGCPSTSNVSCATTLTGVGFQYTCKASRSGLQTPFSSNNNSAVQPTNTVFQVDFQDGDWSIILNTSWQDTKGYTGLVVANRSCTLVPALVEYPVNVTQRTVTLRSPTSTVNWTADSTGMDENSLQVDKVLKILPMPDYDKPERLSGSHSTLGGISLAFSTLFDSSINLESDITNYGADVSVQGAFAVPYAQFPQGTTNEDFLNNTYSSPMDELLADIRDIMFRSSVAIVEHKVADYVWTDGTFLQDAQGSNVPSQNITNSGEYRIYHTVYKTNTLILRIVVGLMVVALLAIMPLFWGFWRLGRKVSMSPLELAKALHYSTITDTQTGAVEAHSVLDVKGHRDRLPQFGSNVPADDLVKLLGKTKVKYGEVAPDILGMGLSEHTRTARKGWRYH